MSVRGQTLYILIKENKYFRRLHFLHRGFLFVCFCFCLLVLIYSLMGAGWLELCISLPPRLLIRLWWKAHSLGSSKIVLLWTNLGQNRTLVYFRWFLFPFCCERLKGIFLQYSLWGPDRASAGKIQKYRGLSLEVVTHRVVHTERLATRQLHPVFPSLVLVPLEVLFMSSCSSKFWISVFACLSDFGVSSLPYDFISLMGLRKIVDFSVYLAFYSCQVRMVTS